ncbi:MAG: peptidase M4 family protein, partial [Prevotellaceae bacterium]|nr:peptidase M4 family protein [Prevotellaceae bacterium]
MWGACIENYVNITYGLNKNIWLHREETGSANRSLSNPNLYGDPDTYQGNNWYAGSNTSTYVHTNSGVGNFWFFLLSQGGTGTNDLGNAYTVIGIGIEKAAKIVYKAETAYLTSSANYTQFRNATISAATNIYGANSSEVIAVTNAWYAVGVGNKYVYNTTISGASQMCVGSSATYTVNNAPTGFTWSCSSNLTKTSGSENTATFTAHSKSSGWVGIRVGNVDIVRKNIIIGTPAGTISGPYDLSCNCLVYPTHPCNYKVKAMSLSESVSSNYIEWRVIPPTAEFIWLYVGENPVVSFLEVGDYTVQMRWKGTCGYSQYTTKTIRIPENSFYSYSAAY